MSHEMKSSLTKLYKVKKLEHQYKIQIKVKGIRC